MYPESLNEMELEEQSMYFCDTMIKHEPLSDNCSEMSEAPVYTDLSPAQFSGQNLALMKQEKTGFTEAFDNLLSWTSKHPEHWSNREVLDWVYYVAEVRHFDCSKLYGENYQTATGQRLCRMTREEFSAMDSIYGSVLYDLFRGLIQKSKFSEPLPPDSMNPDAYPFLDTTFPCLPVPISMVNDACGNNGDSLSVVFTGTGDTAVAIDGNLYDIDVVSKIELPDDGVTRIPFSDDLGYVSAGSDMENMIGRCGSPNSDQYDVFNISDDEDMHTSTFHPFSQPPPRKRPTPSASSDEDNEDKTSTHRRRINSTSKGNHLWEFIRDLLKDPSLNPSLLKWEDKEAGVFKFVQSEAVANMWGRKKNNPGMTYEKLSRAMRFCRSAGYFGDVPKNGKFPKKLCFRFGPKAHDWK